jgi:hypothetical protein
MMHHIDDRICEATVVLRRVVRAAGLLLLGALSVTGPLRAQRPVPPKSWTIDTTSGVPVALRKGGALSSDARADLVGPLRREGPAILDWVRTVARTDAATLGVLEETTADNTVTQTMAGQPMILVAHTVRTAAGSRYITYAVRRDAPSDAPVLVIRSTFGDALTMTRVLRSSIEALLPYVLDPLRTMRDAPVVARGPRPVTSFFGVSGAATAPAEATRDSALTAAVRAGIADAIALSRADSTRRAPGSARP